MIMILIVFLIKKIFGVWVIKMKKKKDKLNNSEKVILVILLVLATIVIVWNVIESSLDSTPIIYSNTSDDEHKLVININNIPPRVTINCDELIEFYKEDNLKKPNIYSSPIIPIWAFKCIELSKEDLENMQDELREINYQINKYGNCYGYCNNNTIVQIKENPKALCYIENEYIICPPVENISILNGSLAYDVVNNEYSICNVVDGDCVWSHIEISGNLTNSTQLNDLSVGYQVIQDGK